MTLPTLFLSHGAPDLLTSEAAARNFLEGLSELVSAPRFIVVASAHWCTLRPAVDVSAKPATLHDFFGFGVELERVMYPARGSPDAARKAVALLRERDFPCDERERGLDHGAWVPLVLAWPRADVPVFQVSISPGLGPAHHLALGRALAPLASAGGLVIGSGGAVHNLGELGTKDAPWARAFDDWLVAAVEAGNEEALVAWRENAPDAALAHPTDEHYLPLLVALGAAGPGARGRPLHRSFTYGTLSMTAFTIATTGAMAG
jgi:4,5-DOPA dioxygenase extradiol